jgi:hypothetical protein
MGWESSDGWGARFDVKLSELSELKSAEASNKLGHMFQASGREAATMDRTNGY